MPPLEMRVLVGPTDEAAFENPSARPIYTGLIPDDTYASVLDIGSGCGRIARHLMQQRPRPESYLGFDPHRGMVRWCQENLSAADPVFRFAHLDIRCPFNPSGVADVLPFPVDRPATLVIACSVYTHLFAHQTEHYLRETASVLAPGGRAVASWFLFDKRYFPFMQDDQNELFINRFDPWNAVVYDRQWLTGAIARAGLLVTAVQAPVVKGHQWTLVLARRSDDGPEVALPDHDDAPFGLARAGHIADPAAVGQTA
jgi:SAM-dependent methyltransferase